MRYHKGQLNRIFLPNFLWAEIIRHCRRKLHGDYLPGEGPAPKAFGLIGGRVDGDRLTVEVVIPLLKNARDCADQKSHMDNAMERHAVPSETPLDHRGWVAEPGELDAALAAIQQQGLRLIGNYHMHRVAWAHDQQRDTPTHLDTILGSTSRMFMFIIAMVNPDTPTIRAFFEGVQDLEVPIEII